MASLANLVQAMDPSNFPNNFPSHERALVEQMHAEADAAMAQHDVDVIMLHDNRTATRQDPADAQIVIPAAPHAVRAASAGGFAYEIVEGRRLVMEARDVPPGGPPEWLVFGFGHEVCWACRDALNYYAGWLRGDRESFGYAGGDDEGTEGVDGAKRKKKKMPQAVVHHWNLVSLLVSANHCTICARLQQRLRGNPVVAMRELANLETRRLEMCWAWKGKDEKEHVLYFIWYDLRKPRGRNNYYTYYRMQLWDEEALDENLMPRPVGGEEEGQEKHVTGRTDSKSTKQMAKGWLARCVENDGEAHDECNSFAVGSSIPTRVLDVQYATETSKLRLICPVDAQRERYITLSHCWGEWGAKELPVLKEANLDERQQEGIGVEDLPQTFRDALEVANWFDVKWLWIDSLCIIQDSPSDWLREASLMTQTYRHALLNISADHSADARGGLFTDRNPLDIIPIKLHAMSIPNITTLPGWQEDAHEKIERSWWMSDYETDAFGWANRASSFSRAWIHRERQLARRILHFTEKEVVWECCGRTPVESLASEKFAGGVPFRRIFKDNAKWQARDLKSAVEKGPEVVYQTWNEVCEGFAEKWLTEPSDMPIILSSLAEEFGAMLPGEGYVAGLWERTLPLALMWKVDRYPDGEIGEFSDLPFAVAKEDAEEMSEYFANTLNRSKLPLEKEPPRLEKEGVFAQNGDEGQIEQREGLTPQEGTGLQVSAGIEVESTTTSGRGTSYVAPSWSWLSIGRSIKLRGRWSQMPLIAIEADEPHINGLRDAFGPFPSDASITLSGYARSIVVTYTSTSVAESMYTPDIVSMRHNYALKVNDSDDGDGECKPRERKVGLSWHADSGRDFEISLDSPEDNNQMRLECACLFVTFEGRKAEDWDLGISALLLKPVEGATKFRRIGTIWFSGLTALKIRYEVGIADEALEEDYWKRIMHDIGADSEEGEEYGEEDEDDMDRKERDEEEDDRENRGRGGEEEVEEKKGQEKDGGNAEDEENEDEDKEECPRVDGPEALYFHDDGICELKKLQIRKVTLV